MANRDGGPAYPGAYETRVGDEWCKSFLPGMTMRQRYKIAAMVLLASAYDHIDDRDIAIACGRVANAMIAEDEAHEREVGDGRVDD